MKRDGRLYLALHVLAHLAMAGDRPTTSEALAGHLGTNPVVIRRSLAGLRDAGIVSSVKGHGGGWTLARPPGSISLGAVYLALGEQSEFRRGSEPDDGRCRVNAVVSAALNETYAELDATFIRRLDQVTLADLVSESPRTGDSIDLMR